MQLDRMLERCRRLEERAAALYRSFAAAGQADPRARLLWTTLEGEEEQHAHSIALAQSSLEGAAGWQTRLDGWEEALAEVEERLARAEQLGPGATTAQQLGAALELEMTELEALRHVLLAASDRAESDGPADHAARLAETAAALSDDPHVRMQAALLRARARLNPSPSA